MPLMSTTNNTILSKRFKFDLNKFQNKNNKLLFSIKDDIDSNNIFNNDEYKCIVCNQKYFHKFSEVDRNLFPVNFYICKCCGIINSDIHFNNNFRNIYYSTYYNQFKTKDYFSNFLNRTKKDSYSFVRYNFIINQLGNNINKIKNIFEPGCNDGCNLYPFKINNYKVYGSDYDEDSIKVGNTYDLNLIKGGIEELINLNIKADLIILSHLIAHVPDLNNFFRLLKKIMHDDTILYIETPGIFSWVQNNKNKIVISDKYISNNNILSFLQLDFCYIFTSSTLNKLLSNYGFVKIYSDELIRGFYKINKSKNASVDNIYIKGYDYQLILDHIINVENNYNTIGRIIKKIIKKIFFFKSF